MPEWSVWRGDATYNEASIDIEASAPYGPFLDLLVDVTSRHPLGRRYVAGASQYPTFGGRSVSPAAIESIGDDFKELIQGLAAQASRRDATRGLPVSNWRTKWQHELSIRASSGRCCHLAGNPSRTVSE